MANNRNNGRNFNLSDRENFKGLWIPKNLFILSDLSWDEKIVLLEICDLHKIGGCFASNQHFSNYTGLSLRQTERIISSLADKEYITTNAKYDPNSNKPRVIDRLLTPTEKTRNIFSSIDKVDDTIDKVDDTNIDKVDEGVSSKMTGGGIQYTNTYNSNTLKETINIDNIERIPETDDAQEPIVLYEIEWKWESEIAYSDYINKQLPKMVRNISKNYSNGDSYSALLKLFKGYFNNYRYFTGERHPWYKEETLQSVLNDLFVFFEHTIELKEIKKYSELFFQKNYKGHEMKVFSSYNTLSWLKAEIEDDYSDVPYKEELPFG